MQITREFQENLTDLICTSLYQYNHIKNNVMHHSMYGIVDTSKGFISCNKVSNNISYSNYQFGFVS